MNSHILLDTNVIQYFVGKKFSSQVREYLFYLENNFNLVPAVSEYSFFEILRGASILVEIEMCKALSFFKSFPINNNLLIASALLHTLYKEDTSINYLDKISDGDKIIATTAILEEGYILTANRTDFCWPYFKEIDNKILVLQDSKKGVKAIGISLLKPNYDLIHKKIKKRVL